MIIYSYDRRAKAELKVLQFARVHKPGEEAEFFLVRREGLFYVLEYAMGSNLSIGIFAKSDSRSTAKSAFGRAVRQSLKGVQLMGGYDRPMGDLIADRMDADAQQHLRAFDSPIVNIDWGSGEEPASDQVDFQQFMQRQIRDWKGSKNPLSATRHEYWPEFHAMIQKAVQKKYGSSFPLFRGIYRDQAKHILLNPHRPLKLSTYSSWADSLEGGKSYRGDQHDHWVVVKAMFRPRDIALAPVMLPDFIEPDILMPLAHDVQHTGDELVVGPKKALRNFQIPLKTRKPL